MSRTRAITDAQLRVLCHALPWRDGLAMRIMRQTGLRVSDTLALRKDQIAPIMTVVERKTGKERTVRLPKSLVKECALYATMTRGPLLLNCCRSTIYRSVHSRAQQLGWDHISAHSARKAYARAYSRKHGTIATQQELRHDRLETTMIYLHDVT